MQESTTYQEILKEGEERGRQVGLQEGEQFGRAEEARGLLLQLGGRRYGAPSIAVQSRIETETQVAQLEVWLDRLLDAESWDELLSDAADVRSNV